MNKLIRMIFLVIITSQLSAQSLKREVVKSSFPSLKEVFYVLKSDPKVRQGKYEKTSRGDLICKGQFEQGKKSGIWEYYDTEKNASHKVDYSSYKLIYPKAKLPSGSEVLGGYTQLYRMIYYTMMYPADARRMGTQGNVKVMFTVDERGQLKNFKVKAGLGNGLDKEAIRAIKECKMEWFPATNENGECVESEIELPISFKLG